MFTASTAVLSATNTTTENTPGILVSPLVTPPPSWGSVFSQEFGIVFRTFRTFRKFQDKASQESGDRAQHMAAVPPLPEGWEERRDPQVSPSESFPRWCYSVSAYLGVMLSESMVQQRSVRISPLRQGGRLRFLQSPRSHLSLSLSSSLARPAQDLIHIPLPFPLVSGQRVLRRSRLETDIMAPPSPSRPACRFTHRHLSRLATTSHRDDQQPSQH